MTEALSADELGRASALVRTIRASVQNRIVGQEQLLDSLLIALMARGHILLESVPGLAKTLATSSLAASVAGSFSRVQCTPDLLPSDIIGTQVLDMAGGQFTTQLGPVHANFVLLDEINRSSAKTQSAMLEAMQERQTSIGGQTYRLPAVFMVLATQNPIDEEGTYVLPQAQMDRFLLKEVLTYPAPDEEYDVLRRLERGVLDATSGPAAEVSLEDVLFLQSALTRVHAADGVLRYLIEVVNVSRNPGYFLGNEVARYIEFGGSPRASIAFLQAGKARALLHGRAHVLPEDVKAVRHSVLRHRIILTFEAVAERIAVEDLIDEIFAVVQAP